LIRFFLFYIYTSATTFPRIPFEPNHSFIFKTAFMKKPLTLLFLLLTSFSLFAQNHPTCDGNRYLNEIFDEVKVTEGLQFGKATTIAGTETDLLLDVYEPIGDDDTEMRPVIILAFGGSFIFGTRADMAWMAELYAKRGFVAVSIDYRLYDLPLLPLPTEEEMTDVVMKAVSDMKAAIRYMRQDADTDNFFRIDPNLVFVGGISAGAITAAHTAVMDEMDDLPDDILNLIEANGGFEGNSSDNYQYTSDVQGLVNFSGALREADWIDENDPPFVSVHDDNDGVVPYGGDNATIFGVDIVYLEGSQLMHERANSLDIENALKTIESNGHVSYFGVAESTAEVMDFSAVFLHDLICSDPILDTEEIITTTDFTAYPNPTTGALSIKNDNLVPLRLTLSNPLGQLVGSWDNANQIDLSGFQNGIYLLKIEPPANSQTFLQKISINK
jgi:dienelactone hydrolase